MILSSSHKAKAKLYVYVAERTVLIAYESLCVNQISQQVDASARRRMHSVLSITAMAEPSSGFVFAMSSLCLRLS